MKKRIVALILAAVMGASLTACGGGTGESGSGNSSSQKSNTESSAKRLKSEYSSHYLEPARLME